MLGELMYRRLEVALAPAPDNQFTGHRVRVVSNTNPKWYSELYYATNRVSRKRIIESLERVSIGAINNSELDNIVSKFVMLLDAEEELLVEVNAEVVDSGERF